MTAAAITGAVGVDGPRRHSLGQSLLLHLLPGAVVMAAFVALVPMAARWNLPSGAALSATGLVAIATVQLALLRRHTGDPAMALRRRLRTRPAVMWILLEVAAAAVAFAATASIAVWLRANVFGWWPQRWAIDIGDHAGYSYRAEAATAVLLLAFGVILAPVVEELYFRGYLLPRMPRSLGRWTPLVHAVLFAAYHLWTPWQIPARVLAVLPLAAVAIRTRDIRIGLVTHVLLNSVDLVVLLHYLLSHQRA